MQNIYGFIRKVGRVEVMNLGFGSVIVFIGHLGRDLLRSYKSYAAKTYQPIL